MKESEKEGEEQERWRGGEGARGFSLALSRTLSEVSLALSRMLSEVSLGCTS